MSTAPVAKEPSLEELRAQAIAAQNAPEAPAAPPPPPDPNEPYTIVEGENGLLELKLRTGEVFKGTALEVAKTIAKSKVDTTDYSKDLKAELTALKASTQHIQDALTPKPPAPTQEEVQQRELQEFLANQNAAYYGYANGETMKQDLAQMRQSSQEYTRNRILMDFVGECPEFPVGNQENSDKLLDTAVKYGILEVNANNELVKEPTAKQLVAAHALCVQLGIYQPLTEAEIQQQINAGMRVKPKMQARPTPPPMVPGTQPETNSQESDPWKIPLNELRERAMGR